MLPYGRQSNLMPTMEANDRNEETSLVKWAWCHIQEGNPIPNALDEEIKESRYLNEMSSVFNLEVICTGTHPSSRPSMKKSCKS